MALITRTGKGSPLTFAEGDANLVYLESLALSGSGGTGVATTGSNIFRGDQTISGSILLPGGRIVSNLYGAGGVDLMAATGQYVELASSNTASFVWVDDNGVFVGTNWNTSPYQWEFNDNGTFVVPGDIIGANNLATTGSNIFVGNQIIRNGTLRLSPGYQLVWTGSEVLNDWNYAPMFNASTTGFLFSPQGIFASSLNQIFINMSGSLGIGKMPTASLDVSGTLFVSNGITGSLLGTASFATTASYYNTSTLATTGSNRFSGLQTITGSILGNVTALTISSNTASLNLTSGSFYTLQLVSGSNTFINPTNIRAGQTVSILVSTTGSATVSFPSVVLQPSGSSYVPTTTTGKDVLTFISFDTTNLYLANVKNLI
jgi:hypothetical protein